MVTDVTVMMIQQVAFRVATFGRSIQPPKENDGVRPAWEEWIALEAKW